MLVFLDKTSRKTVQTTKTTAVAAYYGLECRTIFLVWKGPLGKAHSLVSGGHSAATQHLPKGCSRKMSPSFLHFNGAVCSNTLFSNTSALTNSRLFRANSTRKGSRTLLGSSFGGVLLEHTFCRHFGAFP